MTNAHRQLLLDARKLARTRAPLALALAAGLALGAEAAAARFCSATATSLFQACTSEVRDDYFVANAICINISDEEERRDCALEARDARREGTRLCRDQRRGRLDACRALGQDRYDPDFAPALFDDPRNPTNPNPYFPLEVGNRWDYAGAGETNTVEVLDETKGIEGVSCIVVRDQVFRSGDLVEDTDDWYAAARDGSTWYCGEEVKDFESFDEDDPRVAELVSTDGSFKAGRDGDKPGIIFLASPTPGDVYLEEFSLGNAEDVTEILATDYSFGSDPELDRLVPQALAVRFCSDDCVVTRNFSLLEPGIFARKYYASGIGVFLEVSPDTGEVVQLTDCNFDTRCADLPQP
jgi:hypothetical protein